MINTAMIGAGSISRAHLEAARNVQSIRFCAVSDPLPDRAGAVADQYQLNAYADYKTMVETEKPDAVLIALPHFLHVEAAVWCANQGCHVFLEKPMALSVEECKKIIHAANGAGIRLMVGHSQHYIAENVTAKRLLKELDLGPLTMICDTYTADYYLSDRPQWFLEKDKSGGGILMNLGCHAVDRIQWITGSRIKTVRASLGYHGDRGNVEGNGIVFFQTSDGVPGTILQCGYKCEYVNNTELFFTRGALRIDTGKQLWLSFGGDYQQVEYPPMETFATQLEDFVEHVLRDKPLDCTGEYGLTVISAVESIYRSHERQAEVSVF